tara:strand:- start:5506 stop:6075 length:570 start_codon:yes stop_codon:yes gene_type:complete
VVLVDSTVSKEVLFGRGMTFFANTFKSAKAVIQLSDPVSGKIMGKGIVNDRDVTIIIDCKDGKYRYDISVTPKLITEEIPITVFKGRKWGYMTSDTKITLIWVNGVLDIPLSGVWFTPRGGTSFSYYTAMNAKIGKQYWVTWGNDVRAEIVRFKQKYSSVSDPNNSADQRILTLLTELIHSEMTKVDDW